ncbi:MAG: AAA family ATPase [Pseudomonadota bacterium]|nr:AAA family ATPase [Pseudomonadota bacterium]
MIAAPFARANFFVITGASGGGKSTLVETLRRRGFRVVEEAGRAIVREQLDAGGEALPWADRAAFRDLLLTRSIELFDAVEERDAPVFFDRGVPEAIGYSTLIGSPLAEETLREAEARRYAPTVFVVPPWREIYANDAERRKSWQEVIEDFTATCDAYRGLGYVLVEVPKMSVDLRIDFIGAALGRPL